jgi:uncharacterized metal-binding protein YceD (DUF177 family)
MSDTLPFSRSYNLNRLGQAGDDVALNTTDEERAALARFADIARVGSFSGRAELKKPAPNRFLVDFTLEADIVQACVVSLADVPVHIERRFIRELHFTPALRHSPDLPAAVDLRLEDEMPEEIDGLNYDLAGPLIEEFVLAIDPYPRAPGVAFEPPGGGGEAPENPFAVLKGLKSGL